ncbi:ATPase 2 nuclear control [Nannizzia gypsea CBS 118893]|uniref:ATPase 2 nuclear control n=1 Tax=Arthroderma gypseum (strain ATCC MYA-4604 / CBS 118893) TaxID=535722 RepID=E4V602_ARTGP|nr:ATPase 2 nuclear control [Nannizzia gypsea CBS 118893]EFR05527.1 ATPase 2 nuclear control [Nannizzia gypsea CBS 118893]
MSLIGDHVRRLDSYVDRLQLRGLAAAGVETSQREIAAAQTSEAAGRGARRIQKKPGKTQEDVGSVHSSLLAAARALSGGHTLKPARVLEHLRRVHRLQPAIQTAYTEDIADESIIRDGGDYGGAGDSAYTASLLWLVASKATVQTFASVMTSMVDETVPLSDGIWYWDEVLGSAFYSGLYTLQTAPARWASYLISIYRTTRQTGSNGSSSSSAAEDLSVGSGLHDGTTLIARWRTFYRLVHHGVRARSVTHAKELVLSPFQLSRSRARASRSGLRRLREMTACAVGLLMEEGLLFDVADEDDAITPVLASTGAAPDSTSSLKKHGSPDEWRVIVSRTTLLMQTVLQHVNNLDADLTGFEDNVFSAVESGIQAMEDSLIIEGTGAGTGRSPNPTDQAYQVIQQLVDVLEHHLPRQQEQCRLLARNYARPSRLTRYWPAALGLLLSSSTVLNILTSRRAEMVTWLRELGSTVSDFWTNWIIEPLTRLVGTIRHDEKSEVALMSKNSLDADFSSLERMVVDFVRTRPSQDLGLSDHPDALDLIRQGVRQGDLTPVLRAYERDLQRPFIGAIRGDLVTALLIQIQKTKVDVEVAISGINSILKSQELVFAFIGLTPSILVSYATVQWAAGLLGSRRGLRQGQRRSEIVRSLRTINRILMSSPPSQTGVLSYKDHGLLICETETLRRRAERVLPGAIYHEFHEDLNDLLNVRSGIAHQMKVVDQIRWTYSKWLYS